MIYSRTLFISFLCTFFAVSAYSQSSGSHGGDPLESASILSADKKYTTSWYSVKADLRNGLEDGSYLRIDLKGISPDEFKKRAARLLDYSHVEFNNDVNFVSGIRKPCRNYFDEQGNHQIRCNTNDYIEKMAAIDIQSQYQFITHELFGGDLEPNSYDNSDFYYSSQIALGIQSETVMRWAVGKSRTQRVTCEISLSGDWRKGLIAGASKVVRDTLKKQGCSIVAEDSSVPAILISAPLVWKVDRFGMNGHFATTLTIRFYLPYKTLQEQSWSLENFQAHFPDCPK